ncbi:hypothetical protein BDV93DRAFT_516294 [Ceratobasidium sp. AG-I]|nr:hypothetical protein BDV93DRAFT_516294 [Ceratobasidium sp. AG-I]
MPDPSDSLSADLFELELRGRANRDPRCSWELIWFLQLPLAIRCSYTRILEACIDQDRYRNFLRRQPAYQTRDWRQPRTHDIRSCFHIQQVNPWGSIQRREHQRKPRSALRSFGRRHDSRSRVRFAPDPPYFKAVSPVAAPPALPVDLNWVPERPATPLGLREAIYADAELTFEAGGFDPATGNRRLSYTPLIPATPSPATPSPSTSPEFALPLPDPPVPTVSEQPVYAPGPLYPQGGRFVRVGSDLIPTELAFIIAAGREHRAPWTEGGFPLADVGLDMVDFDSQYPGVLSALSALLFPYGLDDLTQATPYSRVLIDFILGTLDGHPCIPHPSNGSPIHQLSLENSLVLRGLRAIAVTP